MVNCVGMSFQDSSSKLHVVFFATTRRFIFSNPGTGKDVSFQADGGAATKQACYSPEQTRDDGSQLDESRTTRRDGACLASCQSFTR